MLPGAYSPRNSPRAGTPRARGGSGGFSSLSAEDSFFPSAGGGSGSINVGLYGRDDDRLDDDVDDKYGKKIRPGDAKKRSRTSAIVLGTIFTILVLMAMFRIDRPWKGLFAHSNAKKVSGLTKGGWKADPKAKASVREQRKSYLDKIDKENEHRERNGQELIQPVPIAQLLSNKPQSMWDLEHVQTHHKEMKERHRNYAMTWKKHDHMEKLQDEYDYHDLYHAAMEHYAKNEAKAEIEREHDEKLERYEEAQAKTKKKSRGRVRRDHHDEEEYSSHDGGHSAADAAHAKESAKNTNGKAAASGAHGTEEEDHDAERLLEQLAAQKLAAEQAHAARGGASAAHDAGAAAGAAGHQADAAAANAHANAGQAAATGTSTGQHASEADAEAERILEELYAQQLQAREAAGAAAAHGQRMDDATTREEMLRRREEAVHAKEEMYREIERERERRYLEEMYARELETQRMQQGGGAASAGGGGGGGGAGGSAADAYPGHYHHHADASATKGETANAGPTATGATTGDAAKSNTDTTAKDAHAASGSQAGASATAAGGKKR